MKARTIKKRWRRECEDFAKLVRRSNDSAYRIYWRVKVDAIASELQRAVGSDAMLGFSACASARSCTFAGVA